MKKLLAFLLLVLTLTAGCRRTHGPEKVRYESSVELGGPVVLPEPAPSGADEVPLVAAVVGQPASGSPLGTLWLLRGLVERGSANRLRAEQEASRKF